MAIRITKQSHAVCAAINGNADFSVEVTGTIESTIWQKSTDMIQWTNTVYTNTSIHLTELTIADNGSYYRCAIKNSATGEYVYSTPVELFVFDDTFMDKLIHGADLFVAMTNVHSSLRTRTESELTLLINQIQSALDAKSDKGHIHDSRYYPQSTVDTLIDESNQYTDNAIFDIIDGSRRTTLKVLSDDLDNTISDLGRFIEEKPDKSEVVTGLTKEGEIITVTMGDGSSYNITTPDYKVKNSPSSTIKAYITGTTSETEDTGTQVFDTGVYLSTTEGEIVATSFNGTATKATADSEGNNIASTYLKSLNISNGNMIYYTKGDGTSDYLNTNDLLASTGHMAYNDSSNSTKILLTGIIPSSLQSVQGFPCSTSQYDYYNSRDTVYIMGDDLHAANFIGNASSATTDSGGNNIASTYIKSLSMNESTLSYTRGDDTTGFVSLSGLLYTHPTSGVTAGTYRSVTVDANGHVTAGTNPTTISGYGITDAYTKTEVNQKITDLIGGAPDVLDTLKELADALNNDASYAATITSSLSNKADKSDSIKSLSLSGDTLTYTKADSTSGTVSVPLSNKVDKSSGIVGLSINDKVITYTRGDSTTGTITTQDYRVKTIPLADTSTTKIYLSGTTSSNEATGTQNMNANVYLQGTEIHAGKFVGTFEGSSSAASSADKLSTPRSITIDLSHDRDGMKNAPDDIYTVNFDGSGDINFRIEGIHGSNIYGTVPRASEANSAESDGDGNNIVETYSTKAETITAVYISGTTLYVTKNGSTTGTTLPGTTNYTISTHTSVSEIDTAMTHIWGW